MEEGGGGRKQSERVLIRAFVNELLLIDTQMNDYAHSSTRFRSLAVLVIPVCDCFYEKFTQHTLQYTRMHAMVGKWHDSAH